MSKGLVVVVAGVLFVVCGVLGDCARAASAVPAAAHGMVRTRGPNG